MTLTLILVFVPFLFCYMKKNDEPMIVMYMEIFCDHFFIRYFFFSIHSGSIQNLNIDDMWNSRNGNGYESNDVMTNLNLNNKKNKNTLNYYCTFTDSNANQLNWNCVQILDISALFVRFGDHVLCLIQLYSLHYHRWTKFYMQYLF